jgi:predicted transcriptional regulator YheO
MRWDPAPYFVVADAVALLLQPQAEVVVHDLDSDRILHIAGAFSRRRVGDPSLTAIADLQPSDGGVIGPYGKTNFDGRELKSVSATIMGRDGRPAGLFCINLDVSALAKAQAVLETLMLVPAEKQPCVEQLFPADWREQINAEIARFLATRNASLAGLTIADQVDLAAELDAQSFFSIRKAADHIATALGVSRATLYKRLAAARSQDR